MALFTYPEMGHYCHSKAISKVNVLFLTVVAASLWLSQVDGGGLGSSCRRGVDVEEAPQVRRDRDERGTRDQAENNERSGTRSVSRSGSRSGGSRSRSRDSSRRSGSARSRSGSRSVSGGSRSRSGSGSNSGSRASSPGSRSGSRTPSGSRRTHSKHQKAESSKSKGKMPSSSKHKKSSHSGKEKEPSSSSREKRSHHDPSKGKPAHKSSRRPYYEMSRSAKDREREDVPGNLPNIPKREKTRRREAGTSQKQFTSEQESAIQQMLDQRSDGESPSHASRSMEDLKIRLKMDLDDCKRYSSKPQFRQWLKQRNRYLAEATSRDQLRAVAIDVQQLHSNTAEKLRQIMDGQIASGNQDRNKQAARAREEQVAARMRALLGPNYKG